MDMNDGGLTPEERQRQTAAEIARRKVVAAYAQSGQPVISHSYNVMGSGGVGTASASNAGVTSSGAATQSYKSVNPQTVKPAASWQQYHTAWQSYYQKYYSEYYAKAAQKFVEGEKTKMADEAAKEKRAMQELLQKKAEEQKTQFDKKSKELSEREQVLAKAINSSAIRDDADAVEAVEDTLREKIQKKANSRFRLRKKHRKWVPIAAGLFVVLFVLFLQYNRMVFAPIMAYVAPGNVSDEEIAAIDPTLTTAPNGESRLIIPKLNVDVPVHFGIANDTATVNNAMQNGVAHFRVPGASAFPGEVGNTVITGHSAGDVYSSNQYKFIFSGLERLVDGDLIYVNYQSVRYTYKVNGRNTVDPNDVTSLIYTGDKPILTLLTCWPTGTSKYRLEIFADQVSPTVGAVEPNPETPTDNHEEPAETQDMPSNEKTFFERFWDWLTGNGD